MFGSKATPSFDANAQAVNKSNLLAGLTRESAFSGKTGTATGDRAAQDLARGQRFDSAAQLSRSVDKTNAQAHLQNQQAAQQLFNQSQQNELARYRLAMQKASTNSDLAAQMQMFQNNMMTQWRQGLMGLLR